MPVPDPPPDFINKCLNIGTGQGEIHIKAFDHGSRLIFVLLIRIYLRKEINSRQGMLLGVFLVSAFSARFLLEFLKTRQAVYEESLALSVGQWLSLPFVVLGLILLIRSMKSRETPKSKREPQLKNK